MSRILVVDDDPTGLRLVKYILVPEGHEVLNASNGIEGLQVALREVPDLIVLDVMLPGLDGFEVCHRLRGGAKTARIPILMLSGKTRLTDRDIGLKVGADEYLMKPVDRREFLDTVQRLLAQKEVVSQKRARIIAFIGSRGGVGTSTMLTSVSVILAEKGYSPILVDLCPSFGIVPALMGIKPRYTIATLFKGTTGTFSLDDLKQALTQHSSGVRLLSGEQAPEEYGRVAPAGIELLLQELGAMADYIVIDIPASVSEVTGAVLSRCDFVNLVTDPPHESLARISPAVALLSKLGVDQKRLG
ncbi:response regulator, partial [candidate division WOR-3 bacterium]|nr:response regulator [candidate division WOR-3 bacterium]